MGSTIPTIDMSGFDESTQRRHQISHQIDLALRQIGFFQLCGHGIEQAKIDKCFELSECFFDLPLHEKQNYYLASPWFRQGYRSVGNEEIRDQSCVRETFNFTDPRQDYDSIWPDQQELAGLREAANEFHQDCSKLIAKLLRSLAIALRLDSEHYFEDHHMGTQDISSLMHYPAISRSTLRSQKAVRCPAHSDTNTLTLLFQKDVGGLEIANASTTEKITTPAIEKSGQFVQVDPTPGMIVVNVGYLLMRWSNGRWKNTVHRVLEPPSSQGAYQIQGEDGNTIPARYGIAFFCSPDAAVTVEPLPQCYSNDIVNKKWGPLNVGKYLIKKRGILPLVTYPSVVVS